MVTAAQSRLLFNSISRTDGIKVKYYADDLGEIDNLPVVAGDAFVETQADDGRISTMRTRTYLVRVEDLCIGGTMFDPERGHKIEEVDQHGVTNRFEVLPHASGRGYEPWDSYGYAVNITTKWIAKNV